MDNQDTEIKVYLIVTIDNVHFVLLSYRMSRIAIVYTLNI